MTLLRFTLPGGDYFTIRPDRIEAVRPTADGGSEIWTFSGKSVSVQEDRKTVTDLMQDEIFEF